jgi:hypothetical protein
MILRRQPMLRRLTEIVTRFPKTTITLVIIATIFFAIQFPRIKIDTDPENMLEEDQVDRVFYDKLKKEFGIHDLLVVGIVDEEGIFKPDILKRIANVTDDILKIKGVIIDDVVSLRTSNNVTSEGGTLVVSRFMEKFPQSQKEIEELKSALYGNSFFIDKIISRDGKATSIYIPIERKDQSYRISKEIEMILKKELTSKQKYYLAGLPVAEDTFGHEMFIQMGITAPLTGIFIMVLLFLLFRSGMFLIPPMMDAMLAVCWAMGLLIGFGFTVHIMSSMIPIFLMPIALLDDIHILSDFFDRYPSIKDKRKTIITTMRELYRPMFFTSITSAVGFGSLALADIPPVRVFGLFVAFGIMAAWLFSHTIVPAVIMLMNEEKLTHLLERRYKKKSFLDRAIKGFGSFAFIRSKVILLLAVILLAVGIIGIKQIRINDNPVKWFKPYHKIRIADNIMNHFFGGTYMAYLAVEGDKEGIIKRPQVLSYIDKLQNHLGQLPIVGKTSSVADIVKRINYVIHDENKSFDVIPKKQDEIGQYLFLFSMTGDPNDLDNFIDYEAQRANIWVQMKGGDNAQMREVENSTNDFIRNNPPPEGITIKWSGLTYINKVWQNLMVFGMLKAILGSFLVVFLLMVFEFRSIRLGIISMLPLTFTIIFSYGLIGFMGKDYDMPIAVCSSLSLGMAIDFAIHFLQRYKEGYKKYKNVESTNVYIFGEPAKAITRNAIVITFGFLPLLGATLTPYVTVGAFFASLMVFSFLTTLILLPAIMKLCCTKLFVKEVD